MPFPGSFPILINGNKTKQLTLSLGTYLDCPLPPFLFGLVQQALLAQMFRLNPNDEVITTGNQVIQFSACVHYMLVYFTDPTKSRNKNFILVFIMFNTTSHTGLNPK